MTTLLLALAATLTAANAGPAAPGRLSPEVSKEMQAIIVAANKALGLESWPMHDIKPCVDRGGQGITAKDVNADETRKCAASAIDKAFPELGKSYVVAVPMTEVGPVTVLALGIGDSEGWGAYSCDPDRKCLPVKIGAANKWGKRMADRQTSACNDPRTLWFPIDKRACSGGAAPTAAAAPGAPAAPTAPPPAKH